MIPLKLPHTSRPSVGLQKRTWCWRNIQVTRLFKDGSWLRSISVRFQMKRAGPTQLVGYNTQTNVRGIQETPAACVTVKATFEFWTCNTMDWLELFCQKSHCYPILWVGCAMHCLSKCRQIGSTHVCFSFYMLCSTPLPSGKRRWRHPTDGTWQIGESWYGQSFFNPTRLFWLPNWHCLLTIFVFMNGYPTEFLQLTWNNIHGSLPTEIGSLANLGMSNHPAFGVPPSKPCTNFVHYGSAIAS